jgi:hypothetical protein
MNEKLILNCTWGREEPERATLPFIAANIAATAGQDAVALCTIEAVRLGCKGGSEGVEANGQPPSASVSLIVNIRRTQNAALTVLHAISAFGMLTKARRELVFIRKGHCKSPSTAAFSTAVP